MSDIEEDEFQDAQESLPQPTSMDLDTAIMEAKKRYIIFLIMILKKQEKLWSHGQAVACIIL